MSQTIEVNIVLRCDYDPHTDGHPQAYADEITQSIAEGWYGTVKMRGYSTYTKETESPDDYLESLDDSVRRQLVPEPSVPRRQEEPSRVRWSAYRA